MLMYLICFFFQKRKIEPDYFFYDEESGTIHELDSCL
jgi:hypothetical protein